MPVEYYYPTASSDPTPCKWMVELANGEIIYIILL